MTIPNASTSFQFNTTGDRTVGSINESSTDITASCSGATSDFLFANSNNNSLDTGGTGIAKLAGEPTQSITYRLRKSSSGGSKTAWGNTTGDTGNYLVVGTTGGATYFQYHVDSIGGTDPTFPPAGTYQDTLTVVKALNNLKFGQTTTFNPIVTITVPMQCVLQASLGTLTLNYTPNQTVAPATLDFPVSCNVPYTIGLNKASGTLLGVTYMLSLSSAGQNPRANGRTHTITATIPNNQQPGDCPQNNPCNPTATASTPPGEHFVQVTF